jgi:flagellar motility protein MotE (MotC chaperone)
MKDILDKIKDVGKDALGTFVEFDPEERAKPSAPSRAPAAAPVAGPAIPTPSASIPSSIAAAEADPEFVQGLHAAVQASGKAAYTHYRTLYGAMAAVADDRQRTQLALSAAGASNGITPAQVAEAIDDRLRILAGERGAFDKAVQAETTSTIGGTQKEIDKAKAEIARKAEEIQQLEAKRAELERSIAEARASIEANSARFAASYAVVEAELAAERARIAPFLTPTAG